MKKSMYAILGDPVDHSLSPLMMNRAFKELGLEKKFIAIKCNKNELKDTIQYIKEKDFKGLTITMPLKEKVTAHIDGLAGSAELSKVVNCVSLQDGKLIGYNTDAIGFWLALNNILSIKKEEQIKKIFIFGMGGLAKSLIVESIFRGVTHISICNLIKDKHYYKFIDFISDIKKKYPFVNIKIFKSKNELQLRYLNQCNIIVNATPDGLKGGGEIYKAIPYEKLSRDIIYFDSIYSHKPTNFLTYAMKNKNRSLSGLDLLAGQGVYALKIWTGMEVNFLEMKGYIEDYI